ncbi:hypothetical protein PLICRDRAFT_180965 [Plicaturopsis crispa FD-325 SS-3]|uniref:DNA 3'-5' helicase n=1 Tax=Plicaturopsis crispa FD-325 SS-3 TaxID=944288 RepID=A0A0C9SV69_PLICR|nr:hypothetical protein PLICRDRAFT_180965 [Plicaturopsis crispa FD-325 SS-3]
MESAVSRLKAEMDASVKRAVAEGIAEALTRLQVPHAQPPPPPPPVDHAPPPLQDEDFPMQDAPSQPLAPPPPPSSQSVSTAALACLRQFYNDPEAEFKTEDQRRLCELAIERKSNFVGVLPTGGGKSLTFMLPALQEPDSLTIVIVPNRALLDDLLKRAKDAGIPACKWLAKDHRKMNLHGLVFMALESVASLAFKEWYALQEGRVVRVVLDECHQVLTAAGERPKFEKLSGLAQYPVQHLFLTATLPVRLRIAFCNAVAMPRTTPFVHSSTNRLNHHYLVLRYDPFKKNRSPLIAGLCHLAETTFMRPGSIGVVFVSGQRDVPDVANAITKVTNAECHISHGGMDGSERSKNQDEWLSGIGSRWMVSTTGLIHGIDSPLVDVAILDGIIYGLLNGAQGFGRTGRAGQPSLNIQLAPSNTTYMPVVLGRFEEDISCSGEAQAYVCNTTECRRIILSTLMDDSPVTCLDLPGALLCDICDPLLPFNVAACELMVKPNAPPPPRAAPPPPPPPANNDEDMYWNEIDDIDDATLQDIDTTMLDIPPPTSTTTSSAPATTTTVSTAPSTSTSSLPTSNAPSMSIQMDVALYHQGQTSLFNRSRALNTLATLLFKNCFICWAQHGKLVPKTKSHQPFIDCYKGHGGCRYAYGWMAFKRLFKLPRYKYCFKCGCPQSDAHRPECHPQMERYNAGGPCLLEDLVAVLLWHIHHTPAVWSLACQTHDGLFEGMSVDEFAGWVNQVEGVDRFYNGLELVIWFWLLKNDA